MFRYRRVATSGLLCLALCGFPEITLAMCVEPPNGLVAWWSGDEEALDLAGMNDGTLVGGVSYVCGQVAQAFSFDATAGTGVRIPDNDDLRFSGSFTMAAWVRTTGDGFQDILRKRHRDDGGLMDFGIGKAANNTFRILATNDAGGGNYPAGLEGTTLINDGAYHHVVGVRDAENDVLRVYVDGEKQNEGVEVSGTFLEVNAVEWNIGNTGGSQSPWAWSGDIDEVSVYARALSDQEVTDLFTAGIYGQCKPYLYMDGMETGEICWTLSVP